MLSRTLRAPAARADAAPHAEHPLADRGCSRRGFLRLLGAGGAAALFPLAGCNDAPVDPTLRASLTLADDPGKLNGLYALLQLKGEVFERLRRTAYANKTAAEASAFSDIVEHTRAHGLWVSRWLRERRIYDLLLFDLEGVPFGQRAPALALAREIAGEVAAAHVWTAAEMEDPALALVVAKMGSVHARHAAVLRTFTDGGNAFAAPPAVNAAGRTPGRPLREVLERARPFFRTDLQIGS